MNTRFRPFPFPALQLALAVLLSAGGLRAATFTVTNLADAGPGSLRQAVLDANAAGGLDQVTFAPGLTGTITLTSNEIQISDPLILQGPGAGVLTVSGNDQFRIFFVESLTAPAPIDVILSGLTLTHGLGFPIHTFAFGGAVYASGENLSILDSVVSDSTSGFQVDPPPVGCGGNVALFAPSGGSLRIVNTLLSGGTSLGFGSEGGGNLCVINGRLSLERSTLSGGAAAFGGGLYLEALAEDASIVLSTFNGNQASAFGGGIYTDSLGKAAGVVTIESSTISGNSVPSATLGGGIAINGGEVRIFGSTISGNEAGFGSGISNEGGILQLLNSTVSGNRATGQGGGILFSEGLEGSLLLRLTTVSGNSAGLRGGSLLVASPAGAGVVQLDHAIVANGTPEDIAGVGGAPATVTANYSLIEAPGNTVLVGGNNHLGVDPLLGPLAGNGGPTQTQRLLPGSPALDAGDPAIPMPPATDQRGAPRILGPAIDLGSVEGGLGIAEVPALSQLGLLVFGTILLAAALRRLR